MSPHGATPVASTDARAVAPLPRLSPPRRPAGPLPRGTILDGPSGAYAVDSVLGVGGGATTYAATVVRVGPPPPPPGHRAAADANPLPWAPPPPVRPGAACAVGEAVAVKALPLRSVSGWATVDLFRREAELLSSVAHPRIPAYIDTFAAEPGSRSPDSSGDSGDTDGDDRVGGDSGDRGELTYVLVQAAAPGVSLDRLLRGGGRLGAAEVVTLLRQLLDVADYLGGLSPPVVHRDIKPANVMVALGPPVPSGRHVLGGSDATCAGGEGSLSAMLVDWGSVTAGWAADPSDGGDGGSGADGSVGGGSAPTVAGTFGYMAPEQLRGPVDGRADLYAIGATVLAAMTGVAPGSLPSARLRVDVAAALPGDASSPTRAALVDVLQTLLEPAPEDRYPTAAAALAALDSALTRPSSVLSRRAGGWATVAPTVAVVDGRDAAAPRLPAAPRRPPDTTVVVDRNSNSLTITIPSTVSGALVSTAAFTAVWGLAVGAFTASAAAAAAPVAALFSIPFWVAGGDLTRKTAKLLPATTTLSLRCNGGGDEDAGYVLTTVGVGRGGAASAVRGSSLDGLLVEVEAPPPRVSSLPSVGSAADRDDGWLLDGGRRDEDVPDGGGSVGNRSGELLLVEADGTAHAFGAALSGREKAYVAATVAAFLSEVRP